MRRIALTLLLVGCGARTPLGTSVSTQPETCQPKPPRCDHWVLGADHLIEPSRPTEGLSIYSAAVATDCGVLISWERAPWETTRLAPDGSRTDEPNHTTFSHQVGEKMWLAAHGSTIAAMQQGSGPQGSPCVFVPLDVHGANAGAVVQTSDVTGSCRDLAATDAGFSFLSATGRGELFNVDATGALLAQTALNVPSTRSVWDRAMLDDGSFILNSFSEDFLTDVYTTWLRHFDSKGAPVHVAQSGSGLLVVWQWSALEVVPTNRHGVETGQRVDIAMTGPPYGVSVVSLPNGDVMALSVELGGHDFNVTVHQLAPSGLPRGTSLTLPIHPEQSTLTPVVSPNGDLLIAYLENATHDLRVQSLTCVP